MQRQELFPRIGKPYRSLQLDNPGPSAAGDAAEPLIAYVRHTQRKNDSISATPHSNSINTEPFERTTLEALDHVEDDHERACQDQHHKHVVL